MADQADAIHRSSSAKDLYDSYADVKPKFTSKPLLCSILIDGWFQNYSKKEYLQCTKDDLESYDVSKLFQLTRIPPDENIVTEGIAVKITTEQVFNKMRYVRHLRIIIPDELLDRFCDCIKEISSVHNVDQYLQDEQVKKDREEHRRAKRASQNAGFLSRVFVSGFRRYIGVKRSLNRLEQRDHYETIKKRRKVFKWLPVLFNLNDLLHGSWWFTLGSLWVTIVACVILANDFIPVIGGDDSVLTPVQYKASWGLLIASGVFYTIGSLAFVRATNDPPMKPMFTWRHLATDELLGSWMFFWGTLPAVPYSLIFLCVDQNDIYLAMLAVSILGVLGCFFIVVACYPAERKSGGDDDLMQAGHGSGSTSYIMYCVTCCGKVQCTRFVETHLANDWLAGTWLIFWGTALGSFGFVLLTLYDLHHANNITNFVNITSVFDCLLFMIGAFYFVAGSYPLDEEEGSSSSHNSSRESLPVLMEQSTDGTSHAVSGPKTAAAAAERSTGFGHGAVQGAGALQGGVEMHSIARSPMVADADEDHPHLHLPSAASVNPALLEEGASDRVL